MIGGLVRGPVNAISGALGYGDVIPELQLARRLNTAPPETQPGRVMQAIGEVVGSSALPAGGMAVASRAMGTAAPGILSSYAAAPARAVGIDAASSVGGGLGVAAARENDLGSVGEIGLGLAGGFLAPNAVNMAARTYGAADSAVRYGNRAIQNARNPEQAAVDAIADRMVQSGVDPVAVRNQVAPQPSNALLRRGVTPENMADMIARSDAGEAAATIGADYGVSAQTVNRYVAGYRNDNPTPMNLMDIATEQSNAGGAGPILRLGRAAHSLAGDENGVAAQRLVGRQENQGGRVGNIFNQAVANGDFEATRTAGLRNLRDEADTAYGQFNAEPDLATKQLEDLMQDPTFRQAVDHAQEQSRIAAIRRNEDGARAGTTGWQPEPIPFSGKNDPHRQVLRVELEDALKRWGRRPTAVAAAGPV